MAERQLEPPKYCKTCGDKITPLGVETVIEHWRDNEDCLNAALGRTDQ